MSILVITTGGTIGALPYPDFNYSSDFVATMPLAGRDIVRDVLEKNFGSLETHCLSNEPRDSKLIDEPYRAGLLKIIETAPESEILLTHGTDTLLQTAEYFYQRLNAAPALAEKIVLLTGSMMPLSNGPESDGYLNLKFSLEQLNRMASEANKKNCGVYIVLCDFEVPGDETSAWIPRLYRFKPGHYKKFYSEDRRFCRLISIPQPS